MIEQLIAAVKDSFLYQVVITWGGETFHHHAWSLSSALSWIACYPQGTTGSVIAGYRVVARRVA